MSIYLVTGPPGSGKSFFCVKKAMDALESGKWLATNVELHEGWEHGLAGANLFRKPFRKRRAKFAERFKERTFVTHSLRDLTLLRLPPCKKCPACRRGFRCMKEGRGIMLMDEAHNWLNARTWDADESGQGLTKTEAVQNRLRIVRFFSQHRKLGWTVYLVTQDQAQLDAQVRRNFEYHVHLRNFRNFRVAGVRVFPFHLFSAVTTWYDSQQSKVGAQVYGLNRSLARLYDTTATSHGLNWDDPDAIWLGQDAPEDVEEKRRDRYRRATPADVAATIGVLDGKRRLFLRCPNCEMRLPFDSSTYSPPADDQAAEGPLHLRCPKCGEMARLRAPDAPTLHVVGRV